jgi:type IV secretory pathway TraG/TraD family ATPase VirD4
MVMGREWIWLLFFCFMLKFLIDFSNASSKKKKKKHKPTGIQLVTPEKATGVIFGRKGRKLCISRPEDVFHCLCTGGTGAGKTSAILIPTLQSIHDSSVTSFTIDISGDIYSNCPDMPDKLVFKPESKKTVLFNIFGHIDDLITKEAQYEALEQLAFLLMPEKEHMQDSALFFLTEGRKILTASLISFYDLGLDFVEICQKIIASGWKNLFQEIDSTGNQLASMYISGFRSTSEQNTAGSKQAVDSALKLFATNYNISSSIGRPVKEKISFSPKDIETSNIFFVLSEDKLELYRPLSNLLVSLIMQYIMQRTTIPESSQILLSLDEFASLGINEELILAALRRFRKRKCRLLLLTQSLVDFTLLYGSEVTKAILANINFKILLGNLNESESRRYFADLLGMQEHEKRSISKNAKSTTRTTSEEKQYIIDPSEMDKQGKGTVILIGVDGFMKLKKNYYFQN